MKKRIVSLLLAALMLLVLCACGKDTVSLKDPETGSRSEISTWATELYNDGLDYMFDHGFKESEFGRGLYCSKNNPRMTERGGSSWKGKYIVASLGSGGTVIPKYKTSEYGGEDSFHDYPFFTPVGIDGQLRYPNLPAKVWANSREECDYLVVYGGYTSKVDKNYYTAVYSGGGAGSADRVTVTTMYCVIDAHTGKVVNVSKVGTDTPGDYGVSSNIGKLLDKEAQGDISIWVARQWGILDTSSAGALTFNLIDNITSSDTLLAIFIILLTGIAAALIAGLIMLISAGLRALFGKKHSPEEGETETAAPAPRKTGGFIVWSAIDILLCPVEGILALITALRINRAPDADRQRRRVARTRTWCILGSILGFFSIIVIIGAYLSATMP